MRVLLDLRLAAYQPAGIGRYATRLAAALAGRFADLELTCLVPARRSGSLLPPAARRRIAWTPPHFFWEAPLLAAELWREPADIVHWPDFVPGTGWPGRTVITIHDLAFLRHPNLVTPASFRYYSRVRDAARAVDAVIAVSEATRQDAIERLNLNPERVWTVHHGLDPWFSSAPGPADAAVLGRCGIRPPYLLFVGTIEPRKNLPALIRAFSLARGQGLDPELRLVLAGGRGWLADATYRAAYASPARDRILLPGRVREADLPALYRNAAALVLPSIDEGFGLPVLEAMGCGTPVVCSDLPALREVAADAAIFAAVDDEEALAAGLVQALGDAPGRADRVRRGRERAQSFSWERAATETRAIYRRLV